MVSAAFQHTVLIYNPAAGRMRRQASLLPQIVEELERHGMGVRPQPTTGPRTAGDLARRAVQDGAGLVLAMGGDGTVNEVVNGMAGSAVPLGVLPGGTANVLAMELGLGNRPERVVGQIGDWVTRRVAVGQIRTDRDAAGRRFLLMAGLGMDAHIVYHLNADLKHALGKLSYWVSGFSLFGQPLEEFEAHVDGRVLPTSFALVSRVRNYGGDLAISRNAHLLQEDFEVVLFHGRNAAMYVKYLAGVVSGRLDGMQGVTLLRAREARFLGGERVYAQVDGEYAGRLPATVSIEPEALTLLLPPAYVERAKPAPELGLMMQRLADRT